MKKFVWSGLVLLGVLSLTAFIAQKEDKEAMKVECRCKVCGCENCICGTDCSDYRGCHNYETCRECVECDHVGYCCDYGHHGKRHHRHGGCRGSRGC